MAYYLISYDTHNERNFQDLYDGMEANGGERLLQSVWGVELSNTHKEVRDWVVNLLDEDDSILVLKLKPGHAYATQELEKPALRWLSAMNKSVT